MSAQVKVFVLDREHFTAVLRGEARIRNLPSDAQVVAGAHLGAKFGFRVFSQSYQRVPFGEPPPTVQAVVERIAGSATEKA